MDVTRRAGILLPIFSLPSDYGIGNFGKEAFRFVDFLESSGQGLWQILPMGPTIKYESPYQSLSAFAGNPWFIDPQMLMEDGLLTKKELLGHNRDLEGFPCRPGKVNYMGLRACRAALLDKAARRFSESDKGFKRFCADEGWWLDDYTEFLGDEAQRAIQYFFFRQWGALKKYANSKGVEIIGDLPLYVAEESCDYLVNPRLFQTGEKSYRAGHGVSSRKYGARRTVSRPSSVAGVPPDNFSDEGQVWNTPLYDWNENKKSGFKWWLSRIKQAAELYDHVRIDHFRGISEYYSIPTGRPASCGHWEKGPGKEFIDAVNAAAPGLGIIAEDLGFLTEDVIALREYSGWQGMKVLQSAFSMDEESDYLPHNHVRGCVIYTGGHDNRTLKGWTNNENPGSIAKAMDYLGAPSAFKLQKAMIRAALASVAGTAVIPMPDWLGLGDSARINTPGTISGRNWSWRLLPENLTTEASAEILSLTLTYARGHNISYE